MKILGYQIKIGKQSKADNVELKTTPDPRSTKRKRKTSSSIKRLKVPKVEVEMERLNQAIELAEDIERPNRILLYNIYEQIIKRDSHLRSQLRTAHFTIQQSEFYIKKDGTENKQLKELFETSWFTDFISHAVDQEFWGHSLVEFGQIIEGAFKDVLLIDRYHVIPEFQSVRIETNDSIEDAIPYGDNLNNWFLVETGEKRDLGLLMTAAIEIILKKYARTDWSQFNEKFGMPLLTVATDTSNDDELDEIENMAANFGSNGYIVSSKETEYNIETASGTEDGHKKYKDMADDCDGYISKLINGQEATSDNQAWAGSSEVQERVLNAYTLGRLRRIQRIVNDQLIPFLEYHGYPVKGCKLQYKDLEKQDKRSTVTDTEDEKKKSEVKELSSDLNELYSGFKFDNNIINLAGSSDRFKSIFDMLVQKLHTLASKDELPDDDLLILEGTDLIKETALTFEKALGEGFELSSYKPDKEFTEKLTKSVWVFSGFKTDRQLKDISALLTDADGKLKPFIKFRDQVLKIHEDYNVNWLQTEYNQAVSASQSAVHWKQFEAAGDKYNLQYRTAGDERVRGSHQILNRITLPVNHPFWDKYFTPNGWGCRCRIIQVLKSLYKVSSDDEIQKLTDGFFKGSEKIFAYNPGKQAALFPPKHPYYKTQKSLAAVIKNESLQLLQIEINRKLYNQYGKDYIKEGFDEKSGGFWVTHKEHNFHKKTGKYEKSVADYLYKKGYRVELLSEEAGIGIKSLDAKIDDIIYEIKTSVNNSHRSIKSAFEEAKRKKANKLILSIVSDMNYSDLRLSLERIQPIRYGVKELWLIFKGDDWKESF